MRRRDFAKLVAVTVSWPVAARAQRKPMRVIGLLYPGRLGGYPRPALRQALSEAGYEEGRNVVFEVRFAEEHNERLPGLAADLVGRKVEVIMAAGGAPAAMAAKNATSTIPIVFAGIGDPVGIGLVASLARPGGNITGITSFYDEMMPKRFELLAELAPQIRLVAVLLNPDNPWSAASQGQLAQEAAGAMALRLQLLEAKTENEIGPAFASLTQQRAEALVISSDNLFVNHRKQLAELASRYAIPVVYQDRRFVADGGLISYGPINNDLSRETGIYVARILDGANPADLPILRPTKFELVINLKAAQALGLTIPPSILTRADEIIE